MAGMAVQVERLTLEAVHVGDAGEPAVQDTPERRVWKPNPVAMFLPQETPPTKVEPSATVPPLPPLLPPCLSDHPLRVCQSLKLNEDPAPAAGYQGGGVGVQR